MASLKNPTKKKVDCFLGGPNIGEMIDPIWLAHFFSKGLVKKTPTIDTVRIYSLNLGGMFWKLFFWKLFFVGLGPGGLDSWVPLMERDCYLGVPLESQTTN